MLESLEKIPKGINIIVFIWAMIGLYFLLRSPKMRREKLFLIGLGAIVFMGTWRILFGIGTSRYAAGMILPFVVIASFFLYDSRKRRHALIRLPLYGAIACSIFIFLKMNVDSITRNESGIVISEVFRALDGTHGNYTFVAPWKDFRRIYYASHMNGNISAVNKKDVPDFILNYRDVYTDTVFNVESRTIKGNERVMGELDRKHKQIVSLVEEGKTDKKQLIFVLSSDNRCVPVPENRIPAYLPNLLDNGDLEVLDTPEESIGKLKKHIPQYTASADVPSVRTPRNVYFSAASVPEIDLADGSAIDGKYSVRIRTQEITDETDGADKPDKKKTDRAVYLMFDREFSNGDYEYSVLVKGRKGTEVNVLCEIRTERGDDEVRPVATFTIPDKRLFRITARISVNDLRDGNGFRAGVSVRDGEAVFDDFSLTRTTTAAD